MIVFIKLWEIEQVFDRSHMKVWVFCKWSNFTKSNVINEQFQSVSISSTGQTNNRLQETQKQVDEVVGIMRVNVEKVMERDQKLSELDYRADALQDGASQFEQQATKLKRKQWWANMKMMIIMGVIGVLLLIIIICKYSNFSTFCHSCTLLCLACQKSFNRCFVRCCCSWWLLLMKVPHVSVSKIFDNLKEIYALKFIRESRLYQQSIFIAKCEKDFDQTRAIVLNDVFCLRFIPLLFLICEMKPKKNDKRWTFGKYQSGLNWSFSTDASKEEIWI